MISLRNHSMCAWAPQASDSKHSCGYCKNASGSATNGMWAESLTVNDYQLLIDRGWRRSGCYLYKPIMNETCCPQYTIKCDSLNFTLSKSHKKLIKRFNKFVNTGELGKSSCDEYSEDTFNAIFMPSQPPTTSLNTVQNRLENEKLPSTSSSELNTITEVKSSSNYKSDANLGTAHVEKPEKSSVRKGMGADPTKVPCKKAKLLRLERKQKKLEEKGIMQQKQTALNQPKHLEQLLNEINTSSHHKLQTKIVCVSQPGVEWQNSEKIEFQLYEKYQMIVHDDYSTLPKFISFLVNTPLVHVNFDDDDSNLGYGSYHQQYWLDDKLLAVGVMDILPKCVTSVYFFYDPDYRNLTLGIYGMLREIAFAKQINSVRPDIRHYYLGFYIHTCQKMRYKGKLKPSYLLCPETFEWFPIENCISKLDVCKYARLNEDMDAIDMNRCDQSDVDNMKIIYKKQLRLVKNVASSIRSEFEALANLIGKEALKNVIIILTK